ncbi:D-arabinono-1,4-lactone oxidase-domain-containing protein [Lasiosphaeria ovina]|uniref:D-arabinono-1,4-lactone oxidase n=1 Tax=Lasiosphaeria ovina TaxID=92902 RepID=A0AAE0N1B8_9PEZI|nr:D-arabinono-1,4-lactone oxidase-domain-containing protein [Lasiosphaeria ovina]
MATTEKNYGPLFDVDGFSVIEQDDGVPFRARNAHMHRTWARTYTSLPELYIQPESQAEIEKLVNLARRHRRRVTTTGSGHSPSDMTCTSSWLVNLDNFGKVLSIDKETGICSMQAGIRLHRLSAELAAVGLSLPSLGSINEQSIAGAISTGTHGSSIHHGLVSESILALKITLADGHTYSCSPVDNPDLFRAALLSVGALGIITEVTFKAVPAFSLAWDQAIDADARLFEQWDTTLWSQGDFVRIWWFPYMRRAAVWKADVVPQSDIDSGKVAYRDPPKSFCETRLGYFVYHNLLALARWVPCITPFVEWFVFGLQYGFRNGDRTRVSAVQPSQQAFLLDCLYSQFVNEWAIPLHRGPEALKRLGAWLQGLKPGDVGYVDHGIPFSSKGLYVHSPIEVRASNSNVHTSAAANNRPFLDPTPKDGPALYLNATMYRPYHRDPTYEATKRYYEGFEWLMRDLGGRPHWAKTFSVAPDEFAAWYGDDFASFRRVRDAVDPNGLFVGPWHRRYLLGSTLPVNNVLERLPLEEVGFVTEPAGRSGGLLVRGAQSIVVPN